MERANGLLEAAHKLVNRDDALAVLYGEYEYRTPGKSDLTRVEVLDFLRRLLPLLRAGFEVASTIDSYARSVRARRSTLALAIYLDQVWRFSKKSNGDPRILDFVDASVMTALVMAHSLPSLSSRQVHGAHRENARRLLQLFDEVDPSESRHIDGLSRLAKSLAYSTGTEGLGDEVFDSIWTSILAIGGSLRTIPFTTLATQSVGGWTGLLEPSMRAMKSQRSRAFEFRNLRMATDSLWNRDLSTSREQPSEWRNADWTDSPPVAASPSFGSTPSFEAPSAPPSPARPDYSDRPDEVLDDTEAASEGTEGVQVDAIAFRAQLPVYRVWFGTDRKPEGASYANTRNTDNKLHLGHCDVVIPPSHRFGEIGNPWLKRLIRLEFTDDHLFVKETVTVATPEEFVSEIGAALAERDSDERTVLLFIHGYNTSFDQAAVRTAQIGFDLKVAGVAAFYSWPSAGGSAQYLVDEASVETSEARFAEFVKIIATDTGANRVNVVAHSMGNRLLARAARTVVESGVKLGQIVLAAPDIDAQLFTQLAVAYSTLGTGTTMYVSAKDKALDLSHALHSYARAGFTPPVTVLPSIDTIEVTDIDLSLIGHEYFAAAEPVLYDMKAFLDGESDPDRRVRLRKGTEHPGEYWVIGK